MQRETVVGIAWAVGLVLAMAGVFAYEVATFEMDPYHVTWDTESTTVSGQGSLAAGETVTEAFAVPGKDLARVGLALQWDDPDDTFAVQIMGPDGRQSDMVSGDGGALEVLLAVGEARQEGTVDAVDEAHALEQMTAGSPYDGEAEWTVTITLERAPGMEVGGVELQPDGRQAFNYTFHHEHFVGEARAA